MKDFFEIKKKILFLHPPKEDGSLAQLDRAPAF